MDAGDERRPVSATVITYVLYTLRALRQAMKDHTNDWR